jgi:predicted nucleotidyltransferase component of viral defense system
MTNEGYVLKDKSKKTHVLDSFVFAYTNAAGNLDNIKIEVNYILRSHILPSVEVMTQTDNVFSNFAVRTLSPIEICASKIVALTQRSAARDLYDLSKIISSEMFSDKEILTLRKCATFYLALSGDGNALGFNTENMNMITENKVHTDLRQMIRQSERFNLQTAKDNVGNFLLNELMLKDNEKEFLKLFRSGNYKPQLLFDDNEIVKRIENHPMVMWRLRNIREKHER